MGLGVADQAAFQGRSADVDLARHRRQDHAARSVHALSRGGEKKIGVQSELIIIKGASHSFDLQPKQRDLRPDVIRFFDKYLKGGPVY